MQITRVTVYQIDLPLPGKPYYLSGGRVFETLDSTVVAIETDGGIAGWGESCPFGTTSRPTAASPAGARAVRSARPICRPMRLACAPASPSWRRI